MPRGPVWQEIAARQTNQRGLLFHQAGITLARKPLRRVAVQYLDDAMRLADDSLALDPARDFGDRSSADTEHFGKQFLGQGQGIAGGAIRRLQQPAAEAFVDLVQRVAGGRDAGLCQHDLVIAHADIAKRFAGGDGSPEDRRRDLADRKRDLNTARTWERYRSRPATAPTMPSRPTVAVSMALPSRITASSENIPPWGK